MIKFTDTFDSYETTLLDSSSDDSIDFNWHFEETPKLVLDTKESNINEKEDIPLKTSIDDSFS